MSDSVRPHRQQPTRLHHPWDSPGKNTGVGCHFLLQCMRVKSESEVAQSCLTLHVPMDCSLPGSSVHGIFQARVLEWVAIAFSLSNAVHGLTKTQDPREEYMCVCAKSFQSSDCVTSCTVAHQAPLSMTFSRQEYWTVLPFLSPV